MSLSRFNKSSKAFRKERGAFLIARVQAERPDLAEERFIVPPHGNTAQVVMTPREVFKCATSRAQIGPLCREVGVLQAMAGHADTGVTTARVTWQGARGGVYGMTRLFGEPVDGDLLFFLPRAEQTRIAQALGRFNGRMARVLDGGARAAIGVPPATENAYWKITAAKLQDIVSHGGTRVLLGEQAWQQAQRLVRHVARHENTPEVAARVACVHGDMHRHNMFYDSASGQVGLIDLGAGSPARVEHAFSLLRGRYPVHFITDMLAAFGAESGIAVTFDDVVLYHASYVLSQLEADPAHHAAVFRDACPRLIEALDRQQAAATPRRRPLAGAAP